MTLLSYYNSHKKEFLQHINSVDPSTLFTTEGTKQDGSMPFLDTLVTPHEDGTLATSVNRKPPTLIYTFSGTAITTWLVNTVWSIPLHTGPRQYVPTPSCLKKNWNIYIRSFINANIVSGLLTRYCNNKNIEEQETDQTRAETQPDTEKISHSGTLFQRPKWKLQGHL